MSQKMITTGGKPARLRHLFAVVCILTGISAYSQDVLDDYIEEGLQNKGRL